MEKGNSFGVSGTTLGIVGLATSLLIPIISLALCIVGLVFSIMQKKRGKNGWSKAGMILNIIGIAISVLMWVAAAYLISTNPEVGGLISGLGGAGA